MRVFEVVNTPFAVLIIGCVLFFLGFIIRCINHKRHREETSRNIQNNTNNKTGTDEKNAKHCAVNGSVYTVVDEIPVATSTSARHDLSSSSLSGASGFSVGFSGTVPSESVEEKTDATTEEPTTVETAVKADAEPEATTNDETPVAPVTKEETYVFAKNFKNGVLRECSEKEAQYKIFPNASGNGGSIEFCGSMEVAMKLTSAVFDGVGEYEGAITLDSKYSQTPGTVVRDEDDWKIEKFVVVKFE